MLLYVQMMFMKLENCKKFAIYRGKQVGLMFWWSMWVVVAGICKVFHGRMIEVLKKLDFDYDLEGQMTWGSYGGKCIGLGLDISFWYDSGRRGLLGFSLVAGFFLGVGAYILWFFVSVDLHIFILVISWWRKETQIIE